MLLLTNDNESLQYLLSKSIETNPLILWLYYKVEDIHLTNKLRSQMFILSYFFIVEFKINLYESAWYKL